MALAFFKTKRDPKNPTKKFERKLDKVQFTIHKFNNRPKPKKTDRIKIISCFSEFGCEIVGCNYCIPRLLKRYPGQYVIAMGWYGRAYLYRHLVDEFWEIDEEYMWLRDYTRAFHHMSSNLQHLEEAATLYGEVVPSSALGKYAVCNFCKTCGKYWQEWRKRSERCPTCQSTVLARSIFTDIAHYKPEAKRIPRPKPAILQWAKELLPERAVGIFARGRATYGRNLPPEFYVKLISQLEQQGYNIVWLGEKQNILPCPVDHVLDFSQKPEARDLEKTLAVISNLEFTIQFWTASTRLAGMMGVPFLLFESPEQIYASFSGVMSAQEGKRLELTTFGPRKVVLAHYKSVLQDQEKALSLVDEALQEMRQGNYDDMVGLVEDKEFLLQLQQEHYGMLT